MSKCYGCDYYDSSVDACNCDDLCYMDGYEKGRTEAVDEFADLIENAFLNSRFEITDVRKMAEQVKEQKHGEN